MSSKENSNIFNSASKWIGEKKKKKRPLPRKTPPSLSENSDIDSMLKRIRFMDEDLKKKIDRICELTGMTKFELERYIDNPQNFTDVQWKKAQQEKEALEEKIFNQIGIKIKKKLLKKKKAKLAKERRGKTLGSRKKWIQM